MSGLLAGKVWQSNLSSHLKPIAAAMADIANDDGTSIYPSVEYLAWLLSKKDRSVQLALAELRSINVIVVVANEQGGRGKPVEYRLIEDNLPKRIPWREVRAQKKGVTDAPFSKGASGDEKGCNVPTERVQSGAPDPSEPLEEPLEVIEPPFSSPEFMEALAAFEKSQREIRNKLTPTRRKRIYKKLTRWGEAKAITALNDSADGGWKGVFFPKGNDETIRSNNPGQRGSGSANGDSGYNPFEGQRTI